LKNSQVKSGKLSIDLKKTNASSKGIQFAKQQLPVLACPERLAVICKVSTVPVYKKKKRLVISGKVRISVLPRKYSSTVKGVLQYFQGSTPVLPRKYWNQGKL
jgi:hypothetical protein